MRRELVCSILCLIITAGVTDSTSGQSRLEPFLDASTCTDCLTPDDCQADQLEFTNEYVINAVQLCETEPYSRIYDTGYMTTTGTGTCGGGASECGYYQECVPTFTTATLDGEVPDSRHIFRVTVTRKKLTYAGGFYWCDDDGIQVNEIWFTKLDPGEWPCDPQ